jgi:hypothetical protein
MFEINTNILRRMGWRDYSFTRGIGNNPYKYKFFQEDEEVRYFIVFEERKKCFAIKEIVTKDPKLKNSKKYNEYKFITVDFSKKRPNFDVNDFNSNIELLCLIRENLACNLEYQRFFQINSILK